MALTLRPPPNVLTQLRKVAANPAGAAMVDAMAVALAQRATVREQAPHAWTQEDALKALDPQAQDIELFAALRLLQAVDPKKARLGYSHLAEEEPVRIDQKLMLEFAAAEVTDVAASRGTATSNRPTLTQTAVGLLGPNGALPFTWTEFAYDLANSAYRSERDGSFVALINVIQRRQLSFLYRAWSDSVATVGVDRPDESHPVADRLRALGGLALGDLASRDSVAADFKMAFAATLARRVRNPQPLAEMLSAYFEAPVRVEEFVAHWLDIPPAQRTGLGTQFATLGADAVAGARVWDSSTRFRIYIGPLNLERYRTFLPHGEAYAQLADLVALYVGPEYDWELVPVLERRQVPYSWLGNSGLLLGWSSWLGVRYAETDAADLHLQMAPNMKPRAQAPAQEGTW
jgi:type VI secretion system protein ImpH